MNNTVSISEVRFIPVLPKEGLIGFVSFVYNGDFYMGSIAVHSRPQGGIRLVYPMIKGVNAFRPINREISQHIEFIVKDKCKATSN
jgi:hypothetical protein